MGRVLLQLCSLLKLRAVALLRPPAKGVAVADDDRWEATAAKLTALGATHVLKDEGSVKVSRALFIYEIDHCTAFRAVQHPSHDSNQFVSVC